jgi:NAD(P)-dependent dehydrogenase (short-subunit alcohol dehydrogenase family)
MRDPGRAPELAEAAISENLDVTTFPMDVDDDSSVAHGFERVAQQIGRIDVLVNNAGIECVGATEEVPLKDFRAVMETNYFGAIRCIQAVIPTMRRRRSGCIINVASISGRLAASRGCPILC